MNIGDAASLPGKVFLYAQNRLGRELVWDIVAEYPDIWKPGFTLYCTYNFVTVTNLYFYSVQATYV